jgi:hypothetical protein
VTIEQLLTELHEELGRRAILDATDPVALAFAWRGELGWTIDVQLETQKGTG